MSAPVWLAFVTAAAIGAPLRYLLARRVTGALPWGTFLVNVSGSLVFGLLTGMAVYRGFPRSLRLVLGTGFCGAFTTFSAFTFETVRLAEDGRRGAAYGYAAGTIVTCVAAAALGLAIAAI